MRAFLKSFYPNKNLKLHFRSIYETTSAFGSYLLVSVWKDDFVAGRLRLRRRQYVEDKRNGKFARVKITWRAKFY